MTEEVKQPDQEQPEAPELTPIQQKAVEQGWKPKDQFEGNEDEFIDAAEFVRRGELFGKIETQSRELKEVRAALTALKQHHSKVAENEYNRALKSLTEARKVAVAEGETEKAFEIQDQIDQIKEEKSQVAIPDIPSGPPPEFVAWTERNSWYMKDKVMRAAADRIGLDHRAAGMSPTEVLKIVEQEIREAFPHKFTNPNRERPNAVESSSRSGTSVQRKAVALDDGEREIMRKIVRSGVMTEQEYLAELKKVKGL